MKLYLLASVFATDVFLLVLISAVENCLSEISFLTREELEAQIAVMVPQDLQSLSTVAQQCLEYVIH